VLCGQKKWPDGQFFLKSGQAQNPCLYWVCGVLWPDGHFFFYFFIFLKIFIIYRIWKNKWPSGQKVKNGIFSQIKMSTEKEA
jgi:hypothetical protein